jgi:hypothetical protein
MPRQFAMALGLLEVGRIASARKARDVAGFRHGDEAPR